VIQIEGKAPVTPKSLLLRNNMKTYHNTFAAPALLAYGQPSQKAPKIYVNMYFLEHRLKCSL